MTEKELKKLNRYQLLELLVIQTERADKLEKKVEELEEQLRESDLNLLKLGSVAEVAAKVSGILEASQQAADLYLDSAKKQSDRILGYAHREAAAILARAEAKATGASCPQPKDPLEELGKRNMK